MVTTLIFAGGQLDVARPLPAASFVIAADSGLAHAYRLNLAVDLLVGDLDSVAPAALARARRAGVAIDEHPAAKDKTDLELALDHALGRGGHVIVLAASGGRRDHELANLLLLASSSYRSLVIDAWLGAATVSVVHSRRVFAWAVGDTVTLLAAGGAAEGVTTSGLAFPLVGERLAPGSSRGVSNVVEVPECEIAVSSGTLLVVHLPAQLVG